MFFFGLLFAGRSLTGRSSWISADTVGRFAPVTPESHGKRLREDGKRGQLVT